MRLPYYKLSFYHYDIFGELIEIACLKDWDVADHRYGSKPEIEKFYPGLESQVVKEFPHDWNKGVKTTIAKPYQRSIWTLL